MPDLLAAGLANLSVLRHAYMTRTVRDVRGNHHVDLLATVGKTVFRLDAGYGVQERTESRDFLIRPADLVLAGSAVAPTEGDQIQETIGAVTFTFEVMAPGGEPCWRWTDAVQRTYRIHTKQVGP